MTTISPSGPIMHLRVVASLPDECARKASKFAQTAIPPGVEIPDRCEQVARSLSGHEVCDVSCVGKKGDFRRGVALRITHPREMLERGRRKSKGHLGLRRVR